MRGLAAPLVAVALATAPGCVACRPPAPLDASELSELDAIRERLRARDIRIVAPLESGWFESRETLLALEAVRLDSYRGTSEARTGDVVLSVRRTRGDRGSSDVWAAALSTFTLGIVPYFDDGRSSYALRWAAPTRPVRDGECTDEAPNVFGWIAPFVALGDGWRLGGRPGDDPVERRAALARLGFGFARSLDAYVREVVGAAEVR
jgi:hypothetical protein